MAESQPHSTSRHRTTCQRYSGTIDREREREIVSRRFGLFDRKETLEQIGELLGITRERVRQLEKAVVTRLKPQQSRGSWHTSKKSRTFTRSAATNLAASPGSATSPTLTAENSRTTSPVSLSLADSAQASLLSMTDDHFYHSCRPVAAVRDEKAIKATVAKLIEAIKNFGEAYRLSKSR